jgi:sec-independent protein translocase protein TatC
MSQPNEPQEPRPETSPETEGRLTPESSAAVESPPYSESSSYPETEVYADSAAAAPSTEIAPVAPEPVAPAPPPPPPPAKSEEPEGDDEEEHMLRMSFLEHLEELRMRIIKALGGLAVAFGLCLFFTDQLWEAVRQPAASALKSLGFPPELAQITPAESFTIIWVKIPVLTALFIASPWVLYQAWAFISPGLYRRERRLAVPFILSTAGLFILGGLFAYFVALRFGLTFLLGIGANKGVRPMISLTEYTDTFVNVILGVAVVFELPVLIFMLTLIRIVSPRFLLRHSRYAILLITLVAAIITPTPDVVNLTIFAAPMILLYYGGVFASYLLVLNREGKRFPWKTILLVLAILAVAGAFGMNWLTTKYALKWIWKWPFLVK